MSTAHCQKNGLGIAYDRRLIEATIERRGLLSLEIELSRLCNFRCPYCYAATAATAPRDELTDEEARSAIRQARELGARKIIVLGGEPMLHARLFPTLDYIRSLGLEVELFTNGTGITADKARALHALKVHVVLKMNTFDRKTQDILVGYEGGYGIIQSALRHLREAGYPTPDGNPFLAVSTIMCTLNEHELVPLWTWLRDRNILPYFEMITPQGNAVENDWLPLDPQRNRELFETFSRMDRARYGHSWEPQPPLAGNRCQRHKYSCLINAMGEVSPCVGLPIVIGNIRERPLASILADSEVLEDLREHRRWIKGPCGTCDQAETCYGCRGAAYHLTGDYLGSDPRCWKILDRQDEVDCLPAPVNGDIPQQPPMRIVDTLLAIGERSAETIVRIEPDTPFADENGQLDEAAYIEMIAQSIAAFNGFKERGRTARAEGMLLGAKAFHVHQPCVVGDVLNVTVRKTARLGEFGVIRGVIRKGSRVMAEGEIKVWHKTAAGDASA